MSEKKLEGLRVAILATDLFEEPELVEPRKALQEAGARVVVIAPKSGEIQAVQHDRKTQKVKVDMTLDQAKPGEFDALLLPGGAMNADALRMEKKAQEFVRTLDREGKPIAVICHGPWLLISAGLVKGRHMTSYYTIQDDLKNAGAIWNDEVSLRDRNWVSSRQPSDIPQFNKNMIELFSEVRQKAHRAA
ncbi:MAG: type 1 glutamine amidotransferase domain-containing protein [Candidatus Korobacteraceae bacterium]